MDQLKKTPAPQPKSPAKSSPIATRKPSSNSLAANAARHATSKAATTNGDTPHDPSTSKEPGFARPLRPRTSLNTASTPAATPRQRVSSAPSPRTAMSARANRSHDAGTRTPTTPTSPAKGSPSKVASPSRSSPNVTPKAKRVAGPPSVSSEELEMVAVRIPLLEVALD